VSAQGDQRARKGGLGSDCTPCAVTSTEESSRFSQETGQPIASDIKKTAKRTPLGKDDLATLKRMVKEYKSHRLDFTSLPRRPRFKGPRLNTGITIRAEIKKRALERAKSDPDGTGGGSLSGLIELLLWVFLGQPEDIIDKPGPEV
jgi:hypothetical protein